MYIYFVILLLVFFFYLMVYRVKTRNGKLNKRIKDRVFLFLSFSCLGIVIGLRGVKVGEDTWHYSVELFETFKRIGWRQVLTSPAGVVWSRWGEKIEYLFAILYKVVQVFSNSGQVFIFLVAALTCALFARFIYKNIPEHVFFATIVFICDSLFMGAFNGIRQMLALSIAINAYDSIEGKNYKKAICIYTVAFLVHKSTIVFPLLFLLLLIKDKRKGIIYTIIGAIVFCLSMSTVVVVVSKLLPRYTSYFFNNYWTLQLHGVLILWGVIIILSLFLFFKGIRNNQEYFGIIGTILYIGIEIIGLKIVAFTRIEYFFRVFLMMLFPACSERLSKKYRLLYYFFVFALLFAEYYRCSKIEYRQYHFFWE